MLKYLDELKAKYRMYWFVTITPYGKDIEPVVPDKNEVIENFKILSKSIGINSVGWRYDPIFIGNGFDVNKHIQCFKEMASKLKGYTNDVTISFLDLYEKVKRNAPDLRPPTKEECIEIGKAFAKIGKENNMIVHSCCEKTYLAEFGIDCKGCMSKEIVEKGIGTLLFPPKRKNIREDCNCLMGNDIGAYNTCGHLCKYCYANANRTIVKENMKRHNPNSPFLVGNTMPGDKIHSATQKSWIKDEQQLIGGFYK
jgi:DNA repair photolyase